MIIRPKWNPGDRVDYVPKGKSPQPTVQGFGGGGFNLGVQKATEIREGRRHRAVVDAVVDENTIRLMLTESMDTVWAHPDEVQGLDVVSALGDLVGPESRSLKEGLEAMKEAEEDVPKE
jgi:hypothetical protein